MKLTDLQLKNRKKITYCSPFIPAEWIAAFGLTPYFYRPNGSERKGPMYEGRIKNSAGICAFMRSFINEAVEIGDVEGIVITTTCDQMRRAADIVQGYEGKRVFLFHVPATWQTPSAHRYYNEELKRLGGFLKQLGGIELNLENLVSAMRQYSLGRKAILSNPSLLVGENLTNALNSFFETGVPPTSETTQLSGVPVAILGGPLTQVDCGLLKHIEKNGGSIVLDGSDNGERTLPAEFNMRRLTSEPLDVLTEAYFGSIPDVFRRPNNELFVWLKREVKRRHLKGVFLMRYVWCDFWHAEANRLREWLDVPFMDIDLGSEDALSRNNTRIEAFLESLK